MDKSKSTLPEQRTFIETILYYTAIILKYKLMIIVVTILAMAGVVAFSIVSIVLPASESPYPNYYRAYAILMFRENNSSMAGMASFLSTFGMDPSSGGSGAADSSQLALQILHSRPFIDTVVDEMDLITRFGIDDKVRTRSRRIISENTEYAYDQNTGALVIAYTSIDPHFAAEMVNYQVRLLESWFQNEGISVKANQLAMMEDKLDEIAIEIDRIEKQIEAFQLENGALDITQLAETQAAMLLDLRTTLNQVELEISQYSEYSNIDDPALARLKYQRSNIIDQIRRVERGYISSDGRKMPSTEELPQLALEFAHLRNELALQMQLYQTLSERYEVTRLAAAEDNIFSVMEYAEPPEEKQGPVRGVLCMKVSVFAFFGSIAFALFLHFMKGIVSDPKNRAILKGTEE